MNKTFKKLITVMLIMLCLFNFFYSNVPVYAGTGALQTIVNTMVNLLGGVVGLISWIPRLIAMGIGLGVNILTAQVAYMDGTTAGANIDFGETIVITPFEIFFNKVQILDVNFLDLDVDGKTTKVFRTAVAEWYYIMRLVAVSILLLILIYVGIRMAISSVASEKAMYKKSLVDWVTSLALVFLLQYIIMFTVHANAAIVGALESVVKTTNVEEKILGIALISLGISLESMASTAVYVIFVIQVLMFVLKYIKRMLTVAFLIIISPLISITYSIDKMGDGKAQALNTWLKEFVYNVLIQPFHCIIYMAFIGTAFNLLTGGGDSVIKGIAQLLPGLGSSDLANAVLAIMCMLFVDDAEKIVKKIFGFDAASSLSSSLSTLAMAGAISKGSQKAVGAAAGLRKTINTAKEKGVFAAVRKDYINMRDRKKIDTKKDEIKEKYRKEHGGQEMDDKQALKQAREERYSELKNDPEKKREAVIEGALRRRAKLPGNEKLKDPNSAEYQAAKKKLEDNYDTKQTKKRTRKEKINGAVGKIKSTNVGKYYYENSVSQALGIFTGIAGGMANPLAGVAAGMAVNKGASEFFKTSKQHLMEDAAKVTTENTDVTRVFQRGNNGEFEQNSDEMKKIIDEMKKILDQLRDDGKIDENANVDKLANKIQSDINTQMQLDPGALDLNSILRKAVGEDAFDDAELQKSAQDLGQFESDKMLYSYLKKGTDLGMDITDFRDGLQGTIEGHQEVTVNNVIKHLNTNKQVTEIINEVDQGDAQEIYNKIKGIIDEFNNGTIKLSTTQQNRYKAAMQELENTKGVKP